MLKPHLQHFSYEHMYINQCVHVVLPYHGAKTY